MALPLSKMWFTPLLWTLGAGTDCPEERGNYPSPLDARGTENIQICRFSANVLFSIFKHAKFAEVQRGLEFAPLLWTARCRHWMFRREGPWNLLWTVLGIKATRSPISYKCSFLRCQFLKSRPRGETEVLPRRIPDGLSPLDSLPKIFPSIAAQFAMQFARSCRKTLAKQMLTVWCFQQHPRTPSRNKISPMKLKHFFLPNSSSPKLSPDIGPKHLTSKNSNILSPKPSPEHFPTKFSKDVPI